MASSTAWAGPTSSSAHPESWHPSLLGTAGCFPHVTLEPWSPALPPAWEAPAQANPPQQCSDTNQGAGTLSVGQLPGICCLVRVSTSCMGSTGSMLCCAVLERLQQPLLAQPWAGVSPLWTCWGLCPQPCEGHRELPRGAELSEVSPQHIFTVLIFTGSRRSFYLCSKHICTWFQQ